MTKKHFEAIAEILKNSGDDCYEGSGVDKRELIDNFSKWFKSENPNFDEVKFKEAVLK